MSEENSMTVEEKIEAIRRRIINGVAEIKEYHEHWGSDFSLKELNEIFSNKSSFGRNSIDYITIDELQTVPKQKLFEYGFGNWDGGLILIPLWITYFMEPTTEIISISGDWSTISECDKDTRFGCIAYGFSV
jgi:hypothetical protein